MGHQTSVCDGLLVVWVDVCSPSSVTCGISVLRRRWNTPCFVAGHTEAGPPGLWPKVERIPERLRSGTARVSADRDADGYRLSKKGDGIRPTGECGSDCSIPQ